jgi:DNA replication protein DnaC
VAHFAARVELEVLLDAIALDPAWRVERLNHEAALIDGDGIFICASGSSKAEYCSCWFYMWAADVARAQQAKERLLAKAGPMRITEPMFSIEWTFATTQGLESVWIDEVADDVLRDRAYPDMQGGVRAFIARYLAARETVLVLQGPPGTGKTRLIRAILAEMSRRKDEPASALYTGDTQTLASDQVFAR